MTRIKLLAATAMVGALVLGGTVLVGGIAADAASSTVAGVGGTLPANATLPQWKAAVDARIDLRLATLGALKIAINGATNLSSSDKSTLSALATSDTSGLQALRTKTNAETTVAGVRADAKSMIDDYRIYMLVVPKVRFTVAADAETAVIAKLQAAHDKLAALATQLGAAGKNVAPEQAALSDMASKLSAAKSSLNGLTAGLLAAQPSPDASAMQAAVAPVRSGVKAARADLKTAAADAKTAAQGLKSLAAAAS